MCFTRSGQRPVSDSKKGPRGRKGIRGGRPRGTGWRALKRWDRRVEGEGAGEGGSILLIRCTHPAPSPPPCRPPLPSSVDECTSSSATPWQRVHSWTRKPCVYRCKGAIAFCESTCDTVRPLAGKRRMRSQSRGYARGNDLSAWGVK